MSKRGKVCGRWPFAAVMATCVFIGASHATAPSPEVAELKVVDYAKAAPRTLKSFDEAVHIQTAWNAGQYEEVRAYAKTLVDRHDVAGHYWFARIHLEGKGVERDVGVALKHFRIADELGVSFASQTLSTMYSKGDGVLKDVRLARLYRERALLSSSSISAERARAFAPSWAGYKPGDEPFHAIWNQHAQFLRSLSVVEKSSNVASGNEAISDSAEPKAVPAQIPASCRPTTLPRREMLSTRTDEFGGAIQLVIDGRGKSNGMQIVRVSNRDLALGAFWVFFRSLAADKCVFPPDHYDALVEIPFTFKFQ